MTNAYGKRIETCDCNLINNIAQRRLCKYKDSYTYALQLPNTAINCQKLMLHS